MCSAAYGMIARGYNRTILRFKKQHMWFVRHKFPRLGSVVVDCGLLACPLVDQKTSQICFVNRGGGVSEYKHASLWEISVRCLANCVCKATTAL